MTDYGYHCERTYVRTINMRCHDLYYEMESLQGCYYERFHVVFDIT